MLLESYHIGFAKYLQMMKPSVLLSTKFLLPRAGRGYLPRPHLIQWLDGHVEQRLVLLSAPAGYGKTSLLAEYLAKVEIPVAWYQLDPSDSDPITFLTYLLESLRRMKGCTNSQRTSIAQNAWALLQSSQKGIEPQQVMTVLINELGEQLDQPFLVVMDDYHY
ncbi:MAG: hypothetical protein WAV05_14705, partial [Anaerolineales bacterium]